MNVFWGWMRVSLSLYTTYILCIYVYVCVCVSFYAEKLEIEYLSNA